MQILVWRVTVKDHSTVFDQIEDATAFIRGGLANGEFNDETEIVMESKKMGEEKYRMLVEEEDGVKVS